MSLVRLRSVSKRYDSKLVVRNVYFRIDPTDQVGLIGRNGAGKTTVLKLILGQEEPTKGTIDIAQGAKIGYFSRFSELDGEASILEMLDHAFTHIHAIEKELLKIGRALKRHLAERAMSQLLQRQAALFEEMDRRQGWTYKNRIDTVLTKLGFSHALRARPIHQLSGGWRNRAALASILL